MDSKHFVFPLYLRTIVKVYFLFISCPLYFSCKKGSSEVSQRTIWIHQCVCCILHVLVLLFGISSASSLTFINLKQQPSELFRITNEVISLVVTTTAIYTMWFKQNEMMDIVKLGGGESNSSHNSSRKLTAYIIATLFPCILVIQTVIADVFNPSMLKIRLNGLLTAVYLRPEGMVKPEDIEFETWEQVLSYILLVISRYAGLLSTFTLSVMLFGALATHEINTKLLEIVEENEPPKDMRVLHRTVNDFKAMYVAKVHAITKILTTTFIVHSYSFFSQALVTYGEMSVVSKLFNMALIGIVIAAFLIMAESVVTGRKILKKVFLLDERLSSSSTHCIYSVSEIGAMKDLSSLGSSGLFSSVNYGSLGYAFLVILQFAIIMLQFLEIEGKK